MTDEQWGLIFASLQEDILDRRGIKQEWRLINEEVIREQISPKRRRIIEEGLASESAALPNQKVAKEFISRLEPQPIESVFEQIDIEQMERELREAGWAKINMRVWKSPGRGYFLGPYGAWKAMRKGADANG